MFYCIYLFFCVLYFDLLKKNLSDWRETSPAGASQFLETAKDSAGSMPLICRVTNLEPYLLCLACIFQQAGFYFINHPMTRYKTTRDPSYSPKTTRITQNYLILNCLPCLALAFCRNSNKGFGLSFSSLVSVFHHLTKIGSFSSRTCEHNKLCFPEPLVCPLLKLQLTDCHLKEHKKGCYKLLDEIPCVCEISGSSF